jgi:hypothetical protein
MIAGGWLLADEPGPCPRAWTVNPGVYNQLREQADIEERRKQVLADLFNGPRGRRVDRHAA